MSFNRFDLPTHWEHFYTKYPEGYTILEALINWVGQVNDMTDYLNRFIEKFGAEINPAIREVLDGMNEDGTLDTIINETLFDNLHVYVNVEEYPVQLPEVDDTARLQRAITAAAGKTLILPEGKNYIMGQTNISQPINIIIGAEIQANGSVTTDLFHITNTSKVSIIGRKTNKLTGTTSAALSAIVLENVTNFIVEGLNIENFQNKGIAVGNNCSNGMVRDNTISGANSSTGAGISIHGAASKNVTVKDNYVTNNRIGITANGGEKHIIQDNHCPDNNLAGIMLDGIVTGSGDGTKNSTVKNNHVSGTYSTSYAGIYIGNGSSYNVIEGNISINNARSGIRTAGGVGFEPQRNLFKGNVTRGNTYHGLELARANQSLIEGNIVAGNTQRGITGAYSDSATFVNNLIFDNGSEGILWQGGKAYILNNRINGNGMEGIQIAFGGSSPNDCDIIGNDLTGNTGTALVTDGSGHTIQNNRGHVVV